MSDKKILLGSNGLFEWSVEEGYRQVGGFNFIVNSVCRGKDKIWLGTTTGIWELPPHGDGNWIQRHDETVTEVLAAAYSNEAGVLVTTPYGVAAPKHADFNGEPGWRFFGDDLSVNETFTNTLLVRSEDEGEAWIAGTEAGILIFTDSGKIVHRTNLTAVPVRCITQIEDELWAGTDGQGIWKSRNGYSWKLTASGLEDASVFSITQGSSGIFAGTDSGIYRFTGEGKWTLVLPGTVTTSITAVPWDTNLIVAGTAWGGIWYSKNGGIRWINDPELRHVHTVTSFKGAI